LIIFFNRLIFDYFFINIFLNDFIVYLIDYISQYIFLRVRTLVLIQ